MRIKKLLIIALILLLPSVVWGATYYVDVAGIDPDFSGEAADCTTPSDTDYSPITRSCGSGTSTVYDSIKGASDVSGNGDTIYVMSGQYTNAAPYANENRINDTATDITTKGYDDNNPPIIDCASLTDNFIVGKADGQHVENFIAKDLPKASCYGIKIIAGGENLTFKKIEFDNMTDPNVMDLSVIHIEGASGDVLFDKIYIHGNTKTKYRSININAEDTNSVSYTFSNCVFNGEGVINSAIYISQNHHITIYNSDFVGYKRQVIYHNEATSTSNITVTNSIILTEGAEDQSPSAIYITDTDTNCVVKNCLMSGGMVERGGGDAVKGGDQTISNLINRSPKFHSNGVGFGIVTITFDWDSYDPNTYIDVAEVFHEKGLLATFVVNAGYINPIRDAADQDPNNIIEIYNLGMDIGSHGWSHTGLEQGNIPVFDLYYDDTDHGGVCTLDIDANQLIAAVVGDDGGAEELDYMLSDYDGHGDTYGAQQWCAAVNALDDYVCTWNSADLGANPKLQMTSLADVSSQDITGAGNAYTCYTGTNRLLRDEILDNNEWVENLIGDGYECVSYAYGFDERCDDSTVYFRAMDGNSIGQNIKIVADTPDTVNSYLSSYDVMKGFRTSPGTSITDMANNATQQRFMRDVGLDCYLYGRMCHLYFHANDFSAEVQSGLTAAERTVLGECLDALVETGVQVMSMRQAYEYLANVSNGWSYASKTNIFSKTLPRTFDLTLQSSSPCIDAGADLGAAYKLDYSGYDQYGDGRWDVGAYRFLKWGGML